MALDRLQTAAIGMIAVTFGLLSGSSLGQAQTSIDVTIKDHRFTP